MSGGSDISPVGKTGKVLPFPDSPPARKSKPAFQRYVLTGAAFAVLISGGAAAFWFVNGQNELRYATTEATLGAVVRTSSATGTVNPVLTVVVGTYVSGVIQNIYCDYNTHVRQGQVCAKIDPRPYQAVLDQYAAQLARDQALLDKDRMDLARYQKLAAQNAIALQQAEDQAEVVKQDEGTVKLDQALVDGAVLNLNYTNIISPVAGIVVSRSVTGGQTVAASFQTPTLFLIATDLKQMEVDTNTSEGDMGRIKVGNLATFTVDAYPGRTFTGTVTQVRQSPNTVQNVVTYDVVIGLNNDDQALMPGMTASARIILDKRDDVLRVPDQAFRFRPGGVAAIGKNGSVERGQRIFVLRNGRPVDVPVVVGLDDGSVSEIIKGDVRVGDQVILAEISNTQSKQSVGSAPRL